MTVQHRTNYRGDSVAAQLEFVQRHCRMEASHQQHVHNVANVALSPVGRIYSKYDCCPSVSSVQFFDRLGRRGYVTKDSGEILFRCFLQEVLSEQFWHGQGCPVLDVLYPAFALPTMVSPFPPLPFQGAMKSGFGEAVVACDLPEPCKFPSLDSCQKKFLWTHKKTDLVPHPFICLVLQLGDTGTWF